MWRLDRIARAVSDVTVGTVIVIAHAALAERMRVRARRQLERGIEPPRNNVRRSSVD
jgi:hypothetical protein